jgi:DNA-binding CsgD family transcriptional regulator
VALIGRWAKDSADEPSRQPNDLTPQERQIAVLACDGLSNPEPGTRLFLSPRTAEWHLREVFGNLGIHRRRELAGAAAGSTPSCVRAELTRAAAVAIFRGSSSS